MVQAITQINDYRAKRLEDHEAVTDVHESIKRIGLRSTCFEYSTTRLWKQYSSVEDLLTRKQYLRMFNKGGDIEVRIKHLRTVTSSNKIHEEINKLERFWLRVKYAQELKKEAVETGSYV